MPEHFRIFPERASANAAELDALYGFLVAVTIVMTILIFAAVFIFAIKYRRRHENERPHHIHGSMKLEIVWSVIPFFVMLVMFAWGTKLYFETYTTPADAMPIYVTAKQWMWKVQYPEGQREINELHVPVGRPVKLTMASEDVIHSFFVPAFRIKRDVVPGHFNSVSFTPTKAGRYHLFCAEYCGTQHSGMIGWVTVMEPRDYENWLSGGGVSGSMSSQGEKLFQQYGCASCHLLDAQGRCPTLRYVYGNPVKLDDGRTVVADDAYIRESIVNPNAKIVASYHKDIMPTFQGQIPEEGMMQLLAYIKSLAAKPGVGVTATPTAPNAAPNAGTGVTSSGQGTPGARTNLPRPSPSEKKQ